MASVPNIFFHRSGIWREDLLKSQQNLLMKRRDEETNLHMKTKFGFYFLNRLISAIGCSLHFIRMSRQPKIENRHTVFSTRL